ncbi:penicillin-binding protein activator [Pelagibacteraceae bacterium]|nr:penicillin-binding protein activator [Pelagibacteraceae bacterium]
MKKLFIISILTYLLFTINTSGADQDLSKNNNNNKKILKIGVLLPLSGEFENIGHSFLRAIQLALYDIPNKNIKIYPKDNKSNSIDTYKAAKEFEELGIKIVIGPIFYENLEKLEEINNITFISFTNKIKDIPKNTIAFGIDINSQLESINNYLNEIKVSKTILLSPKTQFIEQTEIIENSNLKLDRVFFYDTSPKKITNEIEQLTNYKERKRDLERRVKILEKSDLYKDKQELKKLEQKHTLGKVNFDSVFVVDFGERLKSVLTSFMFSDVSNKKINFFTLNQWFDESLFGENATQNLHFPSIDLTNLKKFEKKYIDSYNKKPNEVSILAYDALGLIYFCWIKNNSDFKTNQLYNKNGFKGLHGEFIIKGNVSLNKLKIYKVHKKKFLKVY